MQRVVVLMSGGLDSATVLAMAQAAGRAVHTLTLSYGQRHMAEIEAARRIAQDAKVDSHREIGVDLSAIGSSALTDVTIPVPEARNQDTAQNREIPVTYVPARNTIMLSVALALAESIGAKEIWCGVNAVDYSGYPDCRPEFIRAFEDLARIATRAGIQGDRILIKAPLIRMSKSEIIKAGTGLGVDYSLTVSCYQATLSGTACGRCEACSIRRLGFEGAGIPDPTRY